MYVNILYPTRYETFTSLQNCTILHFPCLSSFSDVDTCSVRYISHNTCSFPNNIPVQEKTICLKVVTDCQSSPRKT